MGSELLDLFGVLSFSGSLELLDSGLVPVGGSLFTLSFELGNEFSFSPSNLGGKITQDTEFSKTTELDTSQSVWDDLFFDGIIRSWASFEDFEFT